jgi:hypothetical protein
MSEGSRSEPGTAIGVGPGLYGLPRIPLLGNPVNKGKKKGRSLERDAPALASAYFGTLGTRPFLALLLPASQEVIRSPPHGVRGPSYGATYRVRDAAYRSRRDVCHNLTLRNLGRVWNIGS